MAVIEQDFEAMLDPTIQGLDHIDHLHKALPVIDVAAPPFRNIEGSYADEIRAYGVKDDEDDVQEPAEQPKDMPMFGPRPLGPKKDTKNDSSETPGRKSRFDRRDERGESTVSFAGKCAVAVAVGVLVVGAIKGDLSWVNPINWFKGGSSDPAPRGGLVYKGQTARTVTQDLQFKIGDGRSIVDVRAKQDWDDPGDSILEGDWQPTNGTASVADPKDRDQPAKLRVHMEYCADGTLETATAVNAESNEREVTGLTFNVGSIAVCNSHLLVSEGTYNASAFKQDDTPQDFQGKFVSFIAGATEVSAKAAPCPVEELHKYMGTPYSDYIREKLHEKRNVPLNKITVIPGQIGMSDAATQTSLLKELNSYRQQVDPKTHETHKGVDFEYLDTRAKAVTDSCYRDSGSVSLKTLEESSITTPQEASKLNASSGSKGAAAAAHK